jgi:hypothetical protein
MPPVEPLERHDVDSEGVDVRAAQRKARLAPVRCALCGYPVSHYDARVVGAKAGGICMRATCRVNPRTGKPREVFTFEVVAGESDSR